MQRAAGGSLLQLSHQRQDLLLQRFDRERSDLLVTNYALPVDDEGFRNAIHSIVDADAAVAIDDRRRVRIAVLREPGLACAGIVLVLETVDRYGLGRSELHEQRMLLAAGHAPRRPDVEQPHLASEVRV